MKLLECVPNISEGKNKMIIQEIAHAIENTQGVRLLHVDSGQDVNRTVYTFIGEPLQVIEAAYKVFEISSKKINMQKHSGKHPRMGAVDVCPLIPIQNVSMKEAVDLSRRLAQRVSSNLNIPIYLYENSQEKIHRKNLEQIRQGEYEGFFEKIKHADWKPDYGTPILNPQSGASVVGARFFLLAFNVNLSTKDLQLAKNIATRLRTSGGIVRHASHQEKIKQGILPYCKAIAWYVKDFNTIQISSNLTNYKKSSLLDVFENIKSLANENGVQITGSELIGMAPKEAFIESASQIALKTNVDISTFSELEKINLCVNYFNLNACSPFRLNEKILELAMQF